MPAALERCVQDVKGQKGVRDAWAICVAATGMKKKKGGGWTKGKSSTRAKAVAEAFRRKRKGK